jgi:glycosyltransferase involved in cell wall biosynthesis
MYGGTVFFDLVLATVNRRQPLRDLFASLAAQTFQDFRVIVVDQNQPGFLDDVLAEFSEGPHALHITHCLCAPGLSRARNKGLEMLRGRAAAFLDDDATLSPETLSLAAQALNSCDVAIGSCLPPGKETDRTGPSGKRIRSPRALFRSAPSVTLFLRRKVIDRVGRFDESLGLGSGTPYGSGEETDYLVRAFNADCRIVRHPEIVVNHPDQDLSSPGSADKARSYGRGRNRVIRKHSLGTWFVLVNVLHSLIQSGACLHHPKHSRFWFNMALGRLGL